MIATTTNEALAYWRAEYNVTTHVARCECDDCVEVREMAATS